MSVLVINQPFGLGDILFLAPLVKMIEHEHDRIVWPIAKHYIWIKDYIVDIEFQTEEQFEIYKQYHHIYKVEFLNAEYIIRQQGKNPRDCMEAKYMMLDCPLEYFRTLKIVRSREKEQRLIEYLNLPSEFILVNNNFASPELAYKTNIKIESTLPQINLDFIDGYTLLDWCGVLELASEIHTVSTSLFFVVEHLKLSEKISLHLYPRKPLDKDLSPIISLISDKWIKHE